MCKIAGITSVNDDNRKNVWSFMEVLGEKISVFNDDGLGYAAFDKEGNIFGERWLFNEDAFRNPNNITNYEYNYGNAKSSYSFFGEQIKRNEATAIMLHTRMATCDISIENTHPFVNNEDKPRTAMIHNGVISNYYELTMKNSTCDSEVILHEYEKYRCNKDLSNIQSVADSLSGWYNCIVLTYDKHGKPVFDLFTDSGTINTVFVPELDARVYSTSMHDITHVCDVFGYEYTHAYQFKPGTWKRLDPDTGLELESGDFITDRRDYGHSYGTDLDISGDYSQEFIDRLIQQYSGKE